jgi:GntR family transcriptional repressor for pyruvate dehydrogenase complex
MAHRSSEVVAELEQEILQGSLSPGERLPSEEKLCERFQVSRTVIREAIQQLRGRGLLRTLKGSGSYIANPSLKTLGSALETYSVLTPDDSFLELIDLRIIIETECARLAAINAGEMILGQIALILDEMEQSRGDREIFSRADIAFHLAVAKASKNTLFATILDGLQRRCIDYANTNRGDKSWYENVIATHRDILDAISNGDPDRASAAMRRHLLLSRRHYVDLETAEA